jgi:4-hydroxy-tetrahydrodipicolinate synthase
MKKFNPTGTGVALVTPFDDQGEVDYSALGRLIDHVAEGGVEYVVSLGTTGETATLSETEKKEVLSFTVKHSAGRIPVVAGIGGNDTRSLIAAMESYPLEGVSAILSVSPYYNKPSQEGIFRHYQALGSVSPLPLILYNVPGRTGGNMKAATTLRIAHEVPSVIGIKEASGDFIQVMQIIAGAPEGFSVISGDDNLSFPFISLGMCGVISVSAQGFPRIFSGMVRDVLAGRMDKAREAHYQLFKITEMLFAEGNPAGIKAVLNMLGVCGERLRLPLVEISEELRSGMAAELKKISAGKV